MVITVLLFLTYRFRAKDADSTPENARLTYRLLAGDDYGMFRLDPDTGVLRMVRWNDSFALNNMDITKDNSSASTAEDDGSAGPILVRNLPKYCHNSDFITAIYRNFSQMKLIVQECTKKNTKGL